ncbi:MAG: 2-nitropropane dioxygenase [Deltaproteobacteria bacterium]|nr:2-nitropropane dioxygenase [Deltaproteobacteria bacterium]
MIKNRIGELVGIRYPLIQAPMNWVSGAELAAAVSNAGGLGTLGPNAGADAIIEDVELTGERLREQIRKVRRLTGRPFAVNIPIALGEGMKYSKKCVAVVIEGAPNVYTKVLHHGGIKVFHAVSTPRHAKKAEEIGVDAVVCEGYEAGGHKGFTELTTLVLTPMVADAVKIPVIAGGGIGDARGVLAALALGADAVYMGTRFMATKESESHQNVKDAIVRAKDACTVSVPKDFMLARDLSNGFTNQYLEMRKSGISAEALRAFLAKHSQFSAQHLGDVENAELHCGQVAGLIDSAPGAADVISGIIQSIFPVMEEAKRKLAVFQA